MKIIKQESIKGKEWKSKLYSLKVLGELNEKLNKKKVLEWANEKLIF